VNALAWLRRDAGFATLLLEADADPMLLGPVASALVRCGGDRAVPWILRLRDCATVGNGELVRALGELETPPATDALFRFVADPAPATRAAAAFHLGRRERYAEAAAVWRTLDAAGHEAQWERQDLLERMGAAGTAHVDWDALARARGLEPMPLAPVPSLLERVTHASRDVRANAHYELSKQPRPEQLLALAISEELEAAYARLGVPTTSPAWYAWWPILEPLGAPRDSRETGAWVRAHASELPPQELTPELSALLEQGGEALVTRRPAPRFKLSDEERAALEAEEAEVAARVEIAASAAGAPAGPSADDLFGSAHPEETGARFGAPTDGDVPVFRSPGDLAPAEVARGGLIEIDEAEVVLSRRRSDTLLFLEVVARVKPRAPCVRLESLELRARDGEGLLVLGASVAEAKLLRPVARLRIDGHLPIAQAGAVAAAELRAVVREPFQEVAGRWQLPELTGGGARRCELSRVHEGRAVQARVVCHAEPRGELLELDVVVEIGLARPAIMAPPLAVIVAVRSGAGRELTRGVTDVVVPADGSTVPLHPILGLRGEEIAAARWLDVAVRGARTVVEPLASFRLA
jgi:hypothetical protein